MVGPPHPTVSAWIRAFAYPVICISSCKEHAPHNSMFYHRAYTNTTTSSLFEQDGAWNPLGIVPQVTTVFWSHRMCTCSESYTHTPIHTRTHTHTHIHTQDTHTTSGGFTSWVNILWLVLNNHFSRGFSSRTSAISSNLAFIKAILPHSRIWYWFLCVLFCRAPVYWYVPFLFWHLWLFNFYQLFLYLTFPFPPARSRDTSVSCVSVTPFLFRSLGNLGE